MSSTYGNQGSLPENVHLFEKLYVGIGHIQVLQSIKDSFEARNSFIASLGFGND